MNPHSFVEITTDTHMLIIHQHMFSEHWRVKNIKICVFSTTQNDKVWVYNSLDTLQFPSFINFEHMEEWENLQDILKHPFSLIPCLEIMCIHLQWYLWNFKHSFEAIRFKLCILFWFQYHKWLRNTFCWQPYTTVLKSTVYFAIVKQAHCTHTHTYGIITCWYLPARGRTSFLHFRHIEKQPRTNFTQCVASSHQWRAERVPDVVVSHKCRVTNYTGSFLVQKHFEFHELRVTGTFCGCFLWIFVVSRWWHDSLKYV